MMDLIKNAINVINEPVIWVIDPIQSKWTIERAKMFLYLFASLYPILPFLLSLRAWLWLCMCDGNDCEGDK